MDFMTYTALASKLKGLAFLAVIFYHNYFFTFFFFSNIFLSNIHCRNLNLDFSFQLKRLLDNKQKTLFHNSSAYNEARKSKYEYGGHVIRIKHNFAR